MAGHLRAAVAVLLSAFIAGAAAAQEKPPDFYEARRAVALVKVRDASGAVVRAGQGFFLRSGNLVTARHLLDGARQVAVVAASGKEFPATGVVAEDPASDLALLFTEVPEEERHHLAVAERAPRGGEKGWLLARGADGKCEPREVTASPPASFPGIPGVFSAAPAPRAGEAGAPIVTAGLVVLGVADAWAGEAGAAPGFVLPAASVRRLAPTGLRTWAKRTAAPSPHGPAFAAAVAAFLEGRWEDAAKGFQAEGAPFSRAAAAECRRRAGSLADALALADEAVKADGALSEAHRVRGAVLLDLKRNPDAEVAFAKALELDPASVEAALGRGLALARSGKVREAIPVLEAASRLPGSDARPLVALAKAKFSAGEFGEAYEWAERSAERDAASADAREFLGRLQAMAGQLEDAEGSAVLLDALDADSAARLRAVIARIRERMKEPKEKEKEKEK